LFTDRQDEFKELIGELKSDPENGHFIPLGINLIVSDLNYDKFELEEEDIMTALKDPGKKRRRLGKFKIWGFFIKRL